MIIGGCASMAVGSRVVQAAVAQMRIARAALPVELHFDAVVAVGVDHRAFGANHNRGLLALHGRTRVLQ